MPATVLENIKGSEFPAAWQKKMKVVPDEIYSISIRPQKEGATLREVVKKMRANAKRRGLTPEILANALNVDIETIR